MGFFNNILKKLGMGHDDPVAAPSTQASTQASTPAAPPVAIPQIDVVAKLDGLAAANTGLDWKNSIVDLLKLLGLPSDLAARKELAADLHYSGQAADGSAEKNLWLHKTVLQKLAENGGNIPKELL
ncbi:MAG: DUF3597 domain-containing protein [Ideonella sp.]